ncbi:MAG: zinc-ribbon domain-containing protein [Lachnospiraceae bacterium]|nr:zinc-ribbon domain-containing protein [Lachnospiraceae bacterium]
MFCIKCGASIPDNTKFCSVCGAPVEPLNKPAEAQPQQSAPPQQSAAPKMQGPQNPAGARPQKNNSGRVNGGIVAALLIAAVLVAAGLGFGIYALMGKVLDRTAQAVAEEIADETDPDDGWFTSEPETQDPEEPQTVTKLDDSMQTEPETESGPEPVEEGSTEKGEPGRLYVSEVYASSELDAVSKDHKTYFATNAVDDDIHTAWVENEDGVGVGEWITLVLDRQREITEIDFYGGYLLSQYRYTINGKPVYVRVDFSNGTSTYFEGHIMNGGDDDTPFTESDVTPERIVFDTPVKAKSITFTIEDATRGTKYDDTCVSEIRLYGY